MSKLSGPQRTGLSDRETTDFHNQIVKTINGGIEIGSPSTGPININGAWATGVTPNPANTDFALTHNLGKIPTGWWVVWKDQYSDFKIGAGTWTTKQIFLQCNTVGVNFRIFVF